MPTVNVLVIGSQLSSLIKDVFITVLDTPAFFYAEDIDHAFLILSKKNIHLILHLSSNLAFNELDQLKKNKLPLIFLDDITDVESVTLEKDVLFDGFFEQPISRYSLKTFLNELNNYQSSVDSATATPFPTKQPFFFIKYENVYKKIDITDLVWIETDRNYSVLNFTDNKYPLKISLTKLNQNLPDFFLRINKRFVVNTQYIKGINPIKNEVYLKKRTLTIGRTYKAKLLAYLELIY